jgi:hypothetical protein
LFRKFLPTSIPSCVFSSRFKFQVLH